MENEINASQLTMNMDGTIGEEPIESDSLAIEHVDYKKLDKVDLARLCNEKDKTIKNYEDERSHRQDAHNKEIENMNDYYVAKINELKNLIKYYERKFNLIKSLIDIEKGGENNDSIQRTTNR
jgi:esterase/lipase